MDKLQEESGRLVHSTYVRQGVQNLNSRQQLLKILLTHKKLPIAGWDDSTIEFCMAELAAMDSNNFMSNVGVGEREGRVYSNLVSRCHHGLSHGIGRSGDIGEVQPKAAGSSILYKLAISLVQHALQIAGMTFKSTSNVTILPLATGMSLTMCFQTLRWRTGITPGAANATATATATAAVSGSTSVPVSVSASLPLSAKYIIWSRIDQKSCFKSIRTAGYIPLVVELLQGPGGELSTNVAAIEELLQKYAPAGEVLAVLTTTSCFAPRQPDSVDEVAKLCQTYHVAHVINNAYGVQCPLIAKLVMRATVVGRVDYIVQSTDKNFLVPVGGSIVVSQDKENIKRLTAMYPGRANSAPIVDMFITLLSMGEKGYRELLSQRIHVNTLLVAGLDRIAQQHGEALIISPRNGISTAVTLALLDAKEKAYTQVHAREKTTTATTTCAAGAGVSSTVGATFLGAMLFQRGVSGCRVVSNKKKTFQVEGVPFTCWGSHSDTTPHSYFTAACAIGTREEEIVVFLERLDKVMRKMYAQ